MLIRQVWKIKASGQLLVSIPKDSDIKDGDYVEIKKVGDMKNERC